MASRGNLSEGAFLIDLLTDAGADLNARNRSGVTALHMAVRDRSVEAVRHLLHHGADPNVEDGGRGSAPLRRAVADTARSGTGGKKDAALEIVRLLIDHGADVNHVNRSGRTLVESARDRNIIEALQAADATNP